MLVDVGGRHSGTGQAVWHHTMVQQNRLRKVSGIMWKHLKQAEALTESHCLCTH